MGESIRNAVVAGSFYSSNAEELEKDLSKKIVDNVNKIKVKVLISPHAGYFYSGNCAGSGFGSVVIPDSVIILGLDHSGSGYSYSIDSHSKWQTPIGEVTVDKKMQEKLNDESDIFKIDEFTGMKEHSIEVQVPFIRYINPNAKILPIYISGYDFKELEIAGRDLASIIDKAEGDVLIVASTDMSHYVSADFAKEKDSLVIEQIEKLEPLGLMNTVIKEKVSMCGVSPVVVSLITAKILGASKTKIIKYTNSGEASGDFEQVVAYLSMVIY